MVRWRWRWSWYLSCVKARIHRCEVNRKRLGRTTLTLALQTPMVWSLLVTRPVNALEICEVIASRLR